MKKLLMPVIVLTVISFIAAGLLAFTFASTNPRILKLEKQKQSEAFKIIFKTASTFSEKRKNGIDYFQAEDSSGKIVGYIFPVNAMGYSSAGIQMLAGINKKGVVKGVKIVTQLETPGLGSKIDESWFQDQFIDKKASDQLKVKKDVDAITGATISSKAVTKGVRTALDNFEKLGLK
jgi:electron transport complex protein RnfG